MWPPEKTRREEIIDRMFDALGTKLGDGCFGCAFTAATGLSLLGVILLIMNWKGSP